MARKTINFLNRWRSLSRKKKVISVIAVVLLFAVAGGALGYTYWFNKPHQVVTIDPDTGEVIVTEDEGPRLDDRVTILLVGVDERKNQKTNTY
ncbi:MAG TPA: hypothetical protein VNU93_02370, partial [Verrucomicrobiae bacterium]|nr:hypothetical protein [Verrucomicrobiae bacterium]